MESLFAFARGFRLGEQRGAGSAAAQADGGPGWIIAFLIFAGILTFGHMREASASAATHATAVSVQPIGDALMLEGGRRANHVRRHR
jgi:hypothetical protein